MPRSAQIGLIVLLLLGSWLLLSRHKKRPAVAAKVAPAQVVQAAAKPAPAVVPKVSVSSSIKDDRYAMAKVETQIGLQTGGYVQEKDGSKEIEVQLIGSPSCHIGDLDMIRAAIGAASTPIIASLEPMEAAGGIQSHRKLTLAQLNRGVSLKLKVKPGEPELYGLFLCTDGEGTDTCRGKKPANMNSLPGKSTALDGDQVYYFQTLVLDKQRFMHFDSGGPRSENLRKYMEARGDKAAAAAVAEARHYVDIVRSLPVGTVQLADRNGSAVQILLPYAQPTLCATGKTGLPQ